MTKPAEQMDLNDLFGGSLEFTSQFDRPESVGANVVYASESDSDSK